MHTTDHPPRILIVDDETIFRSLTASTLAKEGFEITEAANGAEALDALERHSFDLALLDVRMEGMDGLDLLRLLREESPSTECLILTGFAELDMALHAMKSGAREFLTKPIGNEELIARVKSVWRAHNAEKRLRSLQEDFSEQFLGDLLAPITGMRSALAQLDSPDAGPRSEKQRAAAAALGTSLSHLEAMINDMINLRSYEANRIEVDLIPTNLDKLVPAVCARFNSRAIAGKISLSVTVAPNIPTAEVDPNKIEQVVEHFVDRALRHTPWGGSVDVSVSLRPAGGDRDQIEIAVTNSGPPVPGDEIPLLFDKYKRLLAKPSDNDDVGGLRLPLCKKIIEAHRGSVAADSNGAGGTTILFRLPAS
jgi:signal transduction histidine kinase